MPLYKRFYLIFKDELLVIKKYINKYFNKGFIYFNISLIAIYIYFIKKPKKIFNFILIIKNLTLL